MNILQRRKTLVEANRKMAKELKYERKWREREEEKNIDWAMAYNKLTNDYAELLAQYKKGRAPLRVIICKEEKQ